MHELLASRPILHSRDIEETRAFLRARAVVLDAVGDERDRAGFDVRYNGLYLPRMWLGYIRYGARVATRVSPSRGDCWVHFPMGGRVEITAGRHVLDIDPAQAAVTSPVEGFAMKADAGSARLCLSINGDALRQHLADLLDDAPCEPLHLARTIELQAGFGFGFARLLHAIARDFCTSGSLAHPLVANDFEQLVLTSLLLSVPHNYSEALRRRERRVASRDVRRVEDYVNAHAADPVALGDLARASGVAGRTLLQHFRSVHGMSPMRYLRNHRLQRVRDDLLAPDADNVSAVASRWGFAHLGRFAAAYRARFGESPSATLARGRR